jgi:hypothetical protein
MRPLWEHDLFRPCGTGSNRGPSRYRRDALNRLSKQKGEKGKGIRTILVLLIE